MQPSEYIDRIIQAIVVQDQTGVQSLVENCLNAGIDPMVIVNQALVAGLRTVGDLFAEEEIFLPELVYCGEIVTEAMENLQNLIQGDERRIEKKGLMLVGTVSGDVHDIGKNLVALLMRASGYDVVDLGKDVAAETIVQEVAHRRPRLLGLSSLLATTMRAQQEVITALEEAGLRENLKVMVGGAPVTRAWADRIGADGYAEDATAAVREADGLI
jgi:corrinoid protein of di/trimethylamine methyltransferase